MATIALTTKNNATIEKELLRPLTTKDLVPRLGTSEDMVRIFLRKNYPEVHQKYKQWRISPELAKKIERDYRSQVNAREAQKMLRIQKELAGEM